MAGRCMPGGEREEVSFAGLKKGLCKNLLLMAPQLLLLLLVVSTRTAQVAAVGLEVHVLGDVSMRLPTEDGSNLQR